MKQIRFDHTMSQQLWQSFMWQSYTSMKHQPSFIFTFVFMDSISHRTDDQIKTHALRINASLGLGKYLMREMTHSVKPCWLIQGLVSNIFFAGPQISISSAELCIYSAKGNKFPNEPMHCKANINISQQTINCFFNVYGHNSRNLFVLCCRVPDKLK